MILSKFIPLAMVLLAIIAMTVDANKPLLSPSLCDSHTNIRKANKFDSSVIDAPPVSAITERRMNTNHGLLFSKQQLLYSICGGDDGKQAGTMIDTLDTTTVNTIFPMSQISLLEIIGLAMACVGTFHAGVTTFWPFCKILNKNKNNNTNMDDETSSCAIVHPLVTYFTRATGAIRIFYTIMVVGTVYGSHSMVPSSISSMISPSQTAGLALIPLMVFYAWSLVTCQPQRLKFPLWSLLLNMVFDGFFGTVFLTSSANNLPLKNYPRFLQYAHKYIMNMNMNKKDDVWMKVFGYWNIMLGLMLIMATNFSMNVWGLLLSSANNDKNSDSGEDESTAAAATAAAAAVRHELKSVLRTKLGVHTLLSGLFLLVMSEYKGVKGDLVMAFLVFLIP